MVGLSGIEISVASQTEFPLWWQVRERALRTTPNVYEISAADYKGASQNRREADSALFLIAMCSVGAVAICGISRKTTEKLRHKATIWGLFVEPDIRNQGLARRLVSLAIDEARKSWGTERVRADVVQGNMPGEATFRSLGFEIYGNEPGGLKDAGNLLDILLLSLDCNTIAPQYYE